jgi:hypothetical protein
MDQKLLVNYIKPVIKSLQDDGLKMTRVEVWPGELNGYFTLAISAQWAEDGSRYRVMLILNKIRAMLSPDIYTHIINIYTFDTPESIEKYIDYYVTGRDYFRVQSLYPPKLEAVAA